MTHPLSSANIRSFSPEISNFYYIKKYRYRLHFNTQFLILLTFFESLKIVLINMVAILMMSTKLSPLDLKVKLFGDKGYNVKIYIHDFATNFLHVTQIVL